MKTHEMYVEELAEKNPTIECLGTYTRATDKILHRCRICGHEWLVRPYTLVSKKHGGCPHCAAVKAGKANKSYTTETFVEALESKHDEIVLVGAYPGSHVKASFRCLRCGHEWQARPYSVLQGHGCPRCAKSGTSFMEQVFLGAMRLALGDQNVLSRDKTAIGEELDILLPAERIAFEPGSWALHERRLWKDRQKRELCDGAGIRLVFVYDKFPEGAEKPFDRDCIVFSGDFNREDHSHLWDVVDELLLIAGHPRRFTKKERGDIEAKAYEEAKSLTHEVFMERMAERHPSIEVLGKYVNSNRRVRCRCKACGWEWDAVPAALMSGDGCRKCGAKGRGEAEMLPVDEFARRLREIDPTIEIDPESYRGTHEPVRARCLRCGKEWEPIARTLIRKNPCGCSDCRKKERTEKLDARYREELRKDKPYITCLDRYVTRGTKIRHRCEVCGFVWESTPATVLKSVHGCPNWSAHGQAGRA